MSKRPLTGVGVLVTRPEHQSAELQAAIETAGGRAILFPAIDIVPRPVADIVRDLEALPTPDMLIFISANAVNYGLKQTRRDGIRIAAVGPATKRALEAAGIDVDIVPEGGFDSEHLLATEPLQKVAGMTVLIVRGDSGRELLAETLRERGACVNYLTVYHRRTHAPRSDELENLEKAWREGQVNAVMVMSVASLHSLLEILPDYCRGQLQQTRLVAPGTRVIQTALGQFPGLTGILSPGPMAPDMAGALIASLQEDVDAHNGQEIDTQRRQGPRCGD